MGLNNESWRKAQDQVRSANTLAELAAFELEERADGSPRPSVMRVLSERGAELMGTADDEDKLVALELVDRLDESTISAVIEGGPPPAQVDDDDGSPQVAEGGGPPSTTAGRGPIRAIGGLVRVNHSDGRVEVTALGLLRRRGG